MYKTFRTKEQAANYYGVAQEINCHECGCTFWTNYFSNYSLSKCPNCPVCGQEFDGLFMTRGSLYRK